MEHEDLKPEQFAELKAQLEERDAQYKQLQDKYTKDTSGLNQELSQLRASYEESVINQAVSQHFYGAGGRKGTGDIPPDSFFTMFAPQVKGRIKLIDGKPTVIDAAGSPQTKDGKPVGMNDLMQEMKAGAGGIFFDSSSPGEWYSSRRWTACEWEG